MTEIYLHTLPPIADSLRYLRENDPVFSGLTLEETDFAWRKSEDGFPGLVRIVLGQQLSTTVARTLWDKTAAAISPLTPQRFADATEDELRACGFSRAKIKCVQGMARDILEGRFAPDALAGEQDDEVAAAIMRMKGFGRWSADMYLMFHLARPDIWPVGDLGIQIGLQHYLNAPDRPQPDQVAREGARFSGHRTAASLLLWHLKHLKDREARAVRA